MASHQSDETSCAYKRKEQSDGDTHSIAVLLKERLRKEYKEVPQAAHYIPMKFYLSQENQERPEYQKDIEGWVDMVHNMIKSDQVVQCDHLFKPCAVTDKNVRVVVLKGRAGIGKTTSMRKFILDWAEGRTHQEFTFVVPLDLSSLSSETLQNCSLLQLIGICFPELTDIKLLSATKVLWVLDDLSESRLKLKFWRTKPCSDFTRKASVSSLLVNLLRADIFPEAQIWAAISEEGGLLVPHKYVQRVVEIRGFDDVQWKEYFRKAITDQNVAAEAIIHMRSLSSMYCMCSVPAFCQVAAIVLKELIGNNKELPLTQTQIYTHFFLLCLPGKAEPKKLDAEDVLILGRLAWHGLKKGSLNLFEKDLKENGLDQSVAPQLSHRWPAILERRGTAYHLTHQTLQAYLSALYVTIRYGPTDGHVLTITLTEKAKRLVDRNKIGIDSDMHIQAVDKTLKSKDRRFNSFLVFLIGISAGPSREQLLRFLSASWSSPDPEKTVTYMLNIMSSTSSLDVAANLISCLDELNVSFTLKDDFKALKWSRGSQGDHTPSQWSALARDLLKTEDQHRVVDLTDYEIPDVAFMRLLPVIRASRGIRLCSCTNLTWALLACTLRSPDNGIKEVDIRESWIREKSICLIAEGLKSPNCKVEVLRIMHYQYKNSDPLVAAISLNPSHLRELHIIGSSNSGMVEKLAKILMDPRCHLEKIVLQRHNELSEESCRILATALKSSTCSLKHLDISNNMSRCDDDAAIALSEGLKDSCCQLQTLSMASRYLNPKGFAALISAFASNPSHLRELDLSHSQPGAEAFQQLCALLKKPHFRLETLRLVHCEWMKAWNPSDTHCRARDIYSEGYDSLSSVLGSSSLRVLDLSMNRLNDVSVRLLSTGLGNPACKLQTLRMAYCELTEAGAATLAEVLRANPSHLQELDLSYNSVEGPGFDHLKSLVEEPGIRLKRLIAHGHGKHHGIEELNQYYCPVTLDPNTASADIQVAPGETEVIPCYTTKSPVPENPERFEGSWQVMSREGFTGRHFFQVEWFGRFAGIGMAHKDMSRKGHFVAYSVGHNKKSWALKVSTPFPNCHALHDDVEIPLPDQSPWRVGVYLDWPAGTLSFYNITSEKVLLIYTFYARFLRPLHLVVFSSAGFRLLPLNPHPVCMHDHDPWDMFRGAKDCKGCNGTKAV